MRPHRRRPLRAALAVALTFAPSLGAQPFSSSFFAPAIVGSSWGGMLPDDQSSFRLEWGKEIEMWVRRSSPVLADLNGDGDLEIVVGSLSGLLHVLDPHTGQELPGWPQQLTAPIDCSAAVGDVDGDGQPEIVVGCGVTDVDPEQPTDPRWTPAASGAIYIFNPDGSLHARLATLDWLNMTTGALSPDGFTEAVSANPALADLDDDGVLEIVVGAQDTLVYAFNADGAAHEVSADGRVDRVTPNAARPHWGSILRVDNDNDGRWDEDPLYDRTPFPFGNFIPGLEGVDDDGDGLVDESGIDLNGDGYPEHSVAHWADDDEDSDNPHDASVDYSHVDEDGNEWPQHVSDSVWATPAICDVDGDGRVDIIQPADGFAGARIFVYNREAQMVAGWEGEHLPDMPGWTGVVLPSNVWTGVSVADVDGDGHIEMFMGTNNWWHPTLTSWAHGWVFGLNHNGTEIVDGDGDPSTFGVFAVTQPWPEDPYSHPHVPYVREAPAIGDLNGDGALEIVVAGADEVPGSASRSYNGLPNGGLYAWNADSTPFGGFPISSDDGAGPTYGGVVLADIDGDGDIEILYCTAHGYVEAYHHTGARVQGAPFQGVDFGDGLGVRYFGAFSNTPAAGDIDNDGKVEIVFAGRFWSTDRQVGSAAGLVFVIEAGPYDPAGMEWPMVNANPQHTGVYMGAAETLAGDVNLDGVVDAADLVRMRLALDGARPLESGAALRNALLSGPPPLTEDDFEALVHLLLGQN